MKHISIALSSSNRTDIDKRLSGKYYTPLAIATQMCDSLSVPGQTSIRIGDPFCGDGRLVLAYLKHLQKVGWHPTGTIDVLLWDYDASAVEKAVGAISAYLKDASWDAEVRGWSGDTFAAALESEERLDIILTNPPWELLKPDSRDKIGLADQFKSGLRDYAAEISDAYPEAAGLKRKSMAGYGINLARAGGLASLSLLKSDGLLAVVLPASIFGDQASVPFRNRFFREFSAAEINYYPAECRLFEGVDQACLTIVGRKSGHTQDCLLVRKDSRGDVVESRCLDLAHYKGESLPLLVGSEADALVASLAKRYPTLLNLETDLRFGLWLGREVDETRLTEALTTPSSGVPFLKGRFVHPYRADLSGISHIDPSQKPIPRSIEQRRLAWRDVSRPNQKRRMQVATIPNGVVTGNSLGVAFFRYGSPANIDLLMAIMNSYVFELQVRKHLSTGHVSQGVLRKCVVPWTVFESKEHSEQLMSLIHKRLSHDGDIPELEVMIARLYGLCREEFAKVLSAFDKLSEAEKNALLSAEIWNDC